MGWKLTACGLVIAVSAAADPLTLEEVLASTVRDYPLIEAATQELEGARMDLLSARGGFDPELKARALSFPIGPYPYTRLETTIQQPTPWWGTSVFAGWRRGSGEIPPYYGGYETWSLGEVRAGVMVPLWRNGPTDRRRVSLERSKIGVENAAHAVRQSQLESEKSAAHRYWDWVAAGRKRAVAHELLKIAQDRDSQLSARVRRGDLPALEQVDNQRALIARQSQLVAAERSLQLAALELSLFLRDEKGAPLVPGSERLPQGFPSPAVEPASVRVPELTEVLGRRPDVLRLQALKEQLRLEQRLADNQQAPLIDFTAAAAKDMGTGTPKLGKPELELGLSLDIPLFNRAARGRAGASGASVAKVDAQLQLQQERVYIEVRDAKLALEAAHERWELARREVSAARELASGERTRFVHGDSSLLIVNLREQTAAEAEVREVDALTELFKARANLNAAMAVSARTDSR